MDEDRLFVVRSCEKLMDAEIIIIVRGRYESVGKALHQISRSAVRRALGVSLAIDPACRKAGTDKWPD